MSNSESRESNEEYLRVQWERDVSALNSVYLPFKRRALVEFVRRVCDFLEEEKFGLPDILNALCESFLADGDPVEYTESVLSVLKNTLAECEKKFRSDDI